MRNVNLVRGKCSICGGKIEESWAGKNPSLGTKCENCSSKQKLFTSEHLEIAAQVTINFNPLFGRWEYDFDWRGTKIKVNGKVGVVNSTQGDLSWVDFGEKKAVDEPIKGLGYYDIRRIYEEAGNSISPQPMPYAKHKPVRIRLRKMMLAPVNILRNNDKVLVGVSIDEDGYSPRIPCYQMLHAFCNMYVRQKYGLGPNFAFEGGFVGEGFEVRNMMGGCGLSVQSWTSILKSATSTQEMSILGTIDALLKTDLARRQKKVQQDLRNADVETIISDWVLIMSTLLRYDWKKLPYLTVADVWKVYTKMQNVLLNIMPEDELEAVLEYAKSNEMMHAGSSY